MCSLTVQRKRSRMKAFASKAGGGASLSYWRGHKKNCVASPRGKNFYAAYRRDCSYIVQIYRWLPNIYVPHILGLVQQETECNRKTSHTAHMVCMAYMGHMAYIYYGLGEKGDSGLLSQKSRVKTRMVQWCIHTGANLEDLATCP